MIAKIKEKDIKEVISDITGLQFKSNNLEKCPFCNSGTGRNKTSAFSVNVRKNTFKCYACDVSGSAIDFVMKHENKNEHESIVYLSELYNLQESGFERSEALFETLTERYEELTYKTKETFSDFELKTLGKHITKEICEMFNCKAVEYFITKAPENKPSYKISSTDKFPIFVFEYEKTVGTETKTFNRIYQPFSSEHRFTWVGTPPADHVYADKITAKYLDKLEKGEELPEEKLQKLILCTGTSDAMNVFASGFDDKNEMFNYNVFWLNSETVWSKFETYRFRQLQSIAEEIYVVPDLDETGIAKVNEFSLKFLDVRVVWLPEDLKNFKSKGKPCKDVKDFFNTYKNEKYKNLDFYFAELLRSSNPLRFWDAIYKKKVEFYLSNERIYRFLEANGFYRIPLKNKDKGWSFVHIKNNIVKKIDEDNVVAYINTFVVNYLKKNLDYYHQGLVDRIHKSHDFKISSLSNLRLREDLDFKLADKDSDFFTFKNQAWRISAENIETIPLSVVNKQIWDYAVVDFDAHKTAPLFEIEHTETYKNSQKTDDFPEEEKFKLKINDTDFSYIRYLYNTGRVFWEKEKKGEALSEKEKNIQDLFFISKVIALGYIMFRYKEKSRAKNVYGMDVSYSTFGEHKGGTGKSIYMETASFMNVRNEAYIDGQEYKSDNDRFIFGDVSEETDFVFFEDIVASVYLHRFMNMIQGKMKVEVKGVQHFILDFDDSPKFVMNSNHAIKNLDPSLRRRIWLIGFCDYYHAENKVAGVKEFTPVMEFGKELMRGYDKNEKNKMFNFLANCLQAYLKFREAVESPSEYIEKRNFMRDITESVYDWAEEYFTEINLDREIERTAVFNDYVSSCSDADKKLAKNDARFKHKIETYAVSKGWILNPSELITDKERKRIRRTVNGRKVEFFYIKTITENSPNVDINDIEDLPEDIMPWDKQ